MTAIQGIHPYADKFPMLPDAELQELAESIRENGLRQPVVLTSDGLILDGRNRAKACELAGVEPETTVYEGEDLAEYVIDSNSSRRHMSTGARAMSTALVLVAAVGRSGGKWEYGAVAKAKRSESGTSATQWSQRLAEAGTVLDHAPDLAQQVVSGDLALDAAYRQAEQVRDAERHRLEREERLEAEEADARTFIEDQAPDLAEQVGGPFQTYAEAKAVWEQRNREEAKRLADQKAAKEKAERDRRASLTEMYTGIGRSLMTLGGYGERGNPIIEIMSDFSPTLLDPPQIERTYTLDNMKAARRFLDALIEWRTP